jgi:hypothetical protein
MTAQSAALRASVTQGPDCSRTRGRGGDASATLQLDRQAAGRKAAVVPGLGLINSPEGALHDPSVSLSSAAIIAPDASLLHKSDRPITLRSLGTVAVVDRYGGTM